MKKIIIALCATFFLLSLSTITVMATDTNEIYDTTELYESLSDEVKDNLSKLGICGVDTDSLQNLTFSDVTDEIINLAGKNLDSPLKGLVSITALLLICSLLSTYKTTLSSDISDSINIAAVLCVTCTAAFPTLKVIENTADVINTATDFMLAFIPVIAIVMSVSGHSISGASYYSVMLAAGQGVAQLSSKVVVPFLNMFLGIAVTGGVCPEVKLSGINSLISKLVKWLLGFAMAVFTAVLSFRQIISVSADDVSTRAVRFTLSSFIPIVGSALSEAYKTVQGSVNLLKSGLGVFAIMSISFVFLPVILQCVLWIFTLTIGKSIAEVLDVSKVKDLLEGITAVISTMLAIVLCIMSIYIISTALVLVMGRGGV
ncbi:MAG: hypothetical protein UH080_00135 [Ruminococcus sp.]|nr:hypothetical protein [Ruminococcus sp.]